MQPFPNQLAMTALSAHIVAIRRAGVIQGHQLRINGGGPGQSRYFSAGKHGGPDQARQAAEAAAREMGLPATLPRGAGMRMGRLIKRNRTGVAGIRFEWASYANGPVLYVVATWTDQTRRDRKALYSVERNGLDGALDRALLARTSAGAPMPDRAALLLRLQQAYRAGAA